jgi:hypothetical protein
MRNKRGIIGHGIVTQLYATQFLDTWHKFDLDEFLKNAKPMK